MENLIERTRQSLIAQYGESKTEIVNGMTYTRINSYLDYFDVFVQRFKKVLNKLEFDYSQYESELSTMFEYFEQADQSSIKEISASMRTLISKVNKGNKAEYQAKMQQFFANISTLMKKQNFNLEQIKICFVTDLNLNVVTGRIMRKTCLRTPCW